ncbi:hypothetical protein HBE96_12235 [Clostridium sp. P21]|uniref:Zn-finger containing protein n=1 Tax=Clostridium muellerianum TaxID=2716538 RepID=A0A7Y0HMZ1_9CLOT|nr:hypothetical protein [Clostridium muellerianum]NMM63434.1 hypothetical protein [Clostridium muellerianum]
MNKFSYYLKDCYGLDKFSKYLLIISFILSLNKHMVIMAIVLAAYATWRTISKNRYKRYQELQGFENSILIIKQIIYRFKMKVNDFKYYKVFKCPECSQKLRVPRKKGKILITCKKCHTEFHGRT